MLRNYRARPELNIMCILRLPQSLLTFIYLFIWGFTSLSTLYRSYHGGWLEGQGKPVHTVGQGSVL